MKIRLGAVPFGSQFMVDDSQKVYKLLKNNRVSLPISDKIMFAVRDDFIVVFFHIDQEVRLMDGRTSETCEGNSEAELGKF